MKWIGDGVIICGRSPRRRRHCPSCKCTSGEPKLCDGVIGTTLGGDKITCDAEICSACSAHVKPDLDYCWKHRDQAAK